MVYLTGKTYIALVVPEKSHSEAKAKSFSKLNQKRASYSLFFATNNNLKTDD